MSRPVASVPLLALAAVTIALALGWAPRETYASPGSYHVRQITELTAGGRVDWSQDGRWIYFDDKDVDGMWDVYRIRPDGTARSCLTCDHPQLPNKQQGQPEASPDGRYLVFQAEKLVHAPPYYSTLPGAGHYNDLWVLDLWTDDAYQLTDVNPDSLSGSLHPQFNHDGTKLLWGDMEGPGGRFGDWQLVIADFVTGPTPHLENLQYYNPGPKPLLLESHGWGPDDSWIYFTCTPFADMNDNDMDICRMDFANPTEVTRLTFSSGLNGEPGEWDEHAHLSPRGDVFSWGSSNGYGTEPGDDYWAWLRTEIWLMNADGSQPLQITDYNSSADIILRDNEWNPARDGRRQQLVVSLHDKTTRQGEVVIIDFLVQ